MQPDRGTALLAVVRIVAVLGMSFAIAGGIFLLLWGKILLGLAATVAALPFFALMRYMEKRALEGEGFSRPDSAA
jgi:hypothetical protein